MRPSSGSFLFIVYLLILCPSLACADDPNYEAKLARNSAACNEAMHRVADKRELNDWHSERGSNGRTIKHLREDSLPMR